jgi:hypothetical protein
MKHVHAIDFDATLAHHTGGKALGPPVPAMAEKVRRWLADGDEVRIFTARVSSSHPHVEGMRKEIEDWCERHLGQRLEVTAEKKSDISDIHDDRARQVIPNLGHVVGTRQTAFGSHQDRPESILGQHGQKPGGHAGHGS